MGKRRKPIQFNERRLYYSIKEVAAHFAVNESLIRFWEKEFDNINPKKTASGVRQYSKDDIRQIEIVYHLVKEKGLTLKGARQELSENKDCEEKRVKTLERLKNLQKELVSLEEQFNQLHQIQQYSNRQVEKE